MTIQSVGGSMINGRGARLRSTSLERLENIASGVVLPSATALFPGKDASNANKTPVPLSADARNEPKAFLHHHRCRSMGDSPAVAYFSEALVEGSHPPLGVKHIVCTKKVGRLTFHAPELASCASISLGSRSPAFTERSTPPSDSRQVSPSSLDSKLDAQPEFSYAPVEPSGREPELGPNDDTKYNNTRTSDVSRTLQYLSSDSDSESFAPIESPYTRDAEDNKFSGVVSDGGYNSSLNTQLGCPPFSFQPPFVPSVEGMEDMKMGSQDSERFASHPSVAVAAKRTDAESALDLEKGWPLAKIAAADKPNADVMVIPLARIIPVSAVAEASTQNHGIVLPCAPSDEEKVSYLNTGRTFAVTSGIIAFCTAMVGLWLFTIASPYFFWFGAPTMFLMCYLMFHYFGVAIWGKDFDQEDHAEKIKEANEQAYRPTVDVFLPVCNEHIALLRNTWNHIRALDYPNFAVHVLDDGAKDDVRDLAAVFGFNYLRRDNRPELRKAGNLRYAFARTSGEAIAIFDADFCPRSDFLRETVPHLLDSTIGIVQSPQFFRRRREQTWVEQGAGVTQEFFYRLVQMNQDRFNGSVCVGSCGLYRRSAVEPFGGVAPIEHSEDMYTGYKLSELGYKIKYVPLCLAMGTCPDEPRSFFRQQYRWCMGSATLIFENGFWSANISTIHKICFVNGLLYYISTALIIFVAPVPIMLLILVKADGILWYHSGFAVPAIIMAGLALPLWSTQRYGLACHRVRVIQWTFLTANLFGLPFDRISYAHLFALMDHAMGTAAAWIPSGGGAARSSSKAYNSAIRLMLVWTILYTILIVGGSIWRMMEFPWFHYVPAIVITLGSFYLNMSILRNCPATRLGCLRPSRSLPSVDGDG